MHIDRCPECSSTYYERNQSIQPTETTFFRAHIIPVATQWAKLLQLGPQLEISEAGLLKLIVNSASNVCEYIIIYI